MPLSSWLKLVPNRFARHRKRSFPSARRCRRIASLRLEQLEYRAVPATVAWISATGGNWNTAANWEDLDTHQHRVPNAGDDAVIDLGAGDTVTQSSGTNA